MLSRVAERLYWFARYIERIESTARLLLVRHHLVLDLPAAIQPGWDLIIDVLGAHEPFKESRAKPTEQRIVAFVFGDRNNPCSIISSLTYARENMRTTREVMPSECWERVNSLYLSVARRSSRDLPRSVRHKVLTDIIQRCQQISGMLSGCMNHDEAYHFIRIGRNLERAEMSTRIIDVGSAQLMGAADEVSPYANALWISVLKSLSAYQMYRLNVRRNIQPDAVLEFLLLSEVFPRALARALNEVETGIAILPRNKEATKVTRAVKRKLAKADIVELSGPALHEFIDRVQLRLNDIHTSINATWFAPHVAK
jgi:uncharacterized alpha-E superfamily protein